MLKFILEFRVLKHVLFNFLAWSVYCEPGRGFMNLNLIFRNSLFENLPIFVDFLFVTAGRELLLSR